MKKIPSVSICIPAYNEQNNIDSLLKQILLQKQEGFIIEKIIVASDGSRDKTVKIAGKYRKKGVEVIDGKENRGQTYRQNETISKVSSDILVLLNADLFLKGNNVISGLIEPIKKGADLSAQWAKPAKPKTFIEKTLVAGFVMKYSIYRSYKKGNNIYTCVGHMRALSKNFYQDVSFPEVSYGEDQFLYLTCINRGYRYKNVDKDNLYFKLPDTFGDYVKYAKRIFQTQIKFEENFDKRLLKRERFIPSRLIFQGIISSIQKNPFYTILYLILHTVVQRWALSQPMPTSHIFEVSTSTKRLITNIE